MKNNQDKIEYYLLLLAKLEFPQIENLQQLPIMIADLKAGREFFAKIRDEQQVEDIKQIEASKKRLIWGFFYFRLLSDLHRCMSDFLKEHPNMSDNESQQILISCFNNHLMNITAKPDGISIKDQR